MVKDLEERCMLNAQSGKQMIERTMANMANVQESNPRPWGRRNMHVCHVKDSGRPQDMVVRALEGEGAHESKDGGQ